MRPVACASSRLALAERAEGGTLINADGTLDFEDGQKFWPCFLAPCASS